MSFSTDHVSPTFPVCEHPPGSPSHPIPHDTPRATPHFPSSTGPSSHLSASATSGHPAALSNLQPEQEPPHESSGFSPEQQLLLLDHSQQRVSALPLARLSTHIQPIICLITVERMIFNCWIMTPIASFLHNPNPIFIAFFDAVAVLTAYDPALSVQSLLVTQRTDSKLQHSLYNRCYKHSLTTFQHSLQQLNDPAQLAHYYTSIDDDSGIWARLNVRIGYYSMTNAIFQTAILRRLYLSQPLIPVGMTCTCTGHPTIDTVCRHLFTGCPKHGSRQDIHSTMTGALKICADHAFARTICEDRHILRSANEDIGRRPDLTILNAPHQNGRPLLLDISIVQAFQGSRNLTIPPPRRPPDYNTTLSQKPHQYVLLCHISSLYPSNLPFTAPSKLLPYITPPPLSITLTDADIASAHLHS